MNHTSQTIFDLTVILLLTNIVRAISIKIKASPIIGLVLLGIILGPTFFNVVEISDTIEWIAQIGVLFLIFSAGIQTNLQKLKEESKKTYLPVIGSILVPFIGGFVVTNLFSHNLASSLIIGTIFAAASISVPLMTLFDIDKLKSIEGRCIINSAIIDDIFSIIFISILFAAIASRKSSSILYITIFSTLRFSFFFLTTYLIGKYLIAKFFTNIKRFNLENSILSLCVAVIFIYSWFADYFGMMAITGALISGFVLSLTNARYTLETGMTQVSRSFFTDVFFVSIGLGLNLKFLSVRPLFLFLFVLAALISNFLGPFGGSLLSKLDFSRSLRIGVVLIPRGEVSIIIAATAFQKGLISLELLIASISMVLLTSIVAPSLIKLSYNLTKRAAF